MEIVVLLFSFLILVYGQKSYHNPHFFPGHYGIVQLFEWTFPAISRECQTFLGPKGFGAVQLSPITENIIIKGRPWYERYQPISYKVITRSGNWDQFVHMVKKCNEAKVRVYVDIVINHMSGNTPTRVTKGVGGSTAIPSKRFYSAVPYSDADFNHLCSIEDYSNKSQVRNCELVGLHDLDQSKEYVREKIIDFLNQLIQVGVAGFRVDAASHMWPNDLKVIYERLSNLPIYYSFPENARPFIFQETTLFKEDYINLGRINEFKYAYFITNAAQNNFPLKNYFDLGPKWDLVSSDNAVVFLDNHDTQRNFPTLTYKDPKHYIIGNTYMLAYPYGVPRIMSSYFFSDIHQGPPQDSQEHIINPRYDRKGQCVNGWVCEHRWHPIANMIGFANIVIGTDVNSFWGNNDGQVSFCRGDKGFVAFNTGQKDMSLKLKVCVPPGIYCDIITNSLQNGCNGKKVYVDRNREAIINILANDKNGVLAIHARPMTTRENH